MILVTRVCKYLPNNVHCDYDDGTFEWFDTTEIRIFNPNDKIGRLIDIDHDTPPPIESPWRKIGAILRLEVEDQIFNEKNGQSKEYFSSGIRILAVEKED